MCFPGDGRLAFNLVFMNEVVKQAQLRSVRRSIKRCDHVAVLEHLLG